MGVAREYEFSPNDIYYQAARNFWNIVIKDHTLAIGGNSCYERFGVLGEESKRLDYTSAETCNTYNMLKLSRQLFMLDGDYKYLNYYEHALYNHILASQDPDMPVLRLDACPGESDSRRTGGALRFAWTS